VGGLYRSSLTWRSSPEGLYPSPYWRWHFCLTDRLLARRPERIFINPLEQGEIGPDLSRKACEFGLEGLVSKHGDRPYQAGRSSTGQRLTCGDDHFPPRENRLSTRLVHVFRQL
jgi:hypothetical protein